MAELKQHCLRAFAKGVHKANLFRGIERWAQKRQISPGRFGLPRITRFRGSKFGILCYHRVGTDGVPIFSRLKPEIFEQQIRYLITHYRVISLTRLRSELMSRVQVEPSIAITFDDGYRDLYHYAFPVLKKYSVPATIYLIADCTDTGEAPWYDRLFVALQNAKGKLDVPIPEPRTFSLSSPGERAAAAWEIICFLRSIPNNERVNWCKKFEKEFPPRRDLLTDRMLSWDQVRCMQANGISFGAHTMSHPSVGRLESGELEYELADSKRLLEARLQAPVADFAYPFGKEVDRSVSADQFIRSCGYQSAVTTSSGFNSCDSDLYKLRRMQVPDDPSLSMFALNLTRLFLEFTPDERDAHTTLSQLPQRRVMTERSSA